MPQYKVIAPGFYGGQWYDPEGKRKTLTTDKPFPKKDKKEQIPSWLASMPKESAAVKSKRQAQAASRKEADETKAKDDQQDIENASFMGEGENAAGSAVETL